MRLLPDSGSVTSRRGASSVAAMRGFRLHRSRRNARHAESNRPVHDVTIDFMPTGHQQAIQEQFTRTAEAFAKFATRDTPEMLAERLEFAGLRPHELVLDVACGPGAFVIAAAPQVRFATGVDLTPEMLRQARAFQAGRGIANAAFELGEAERLPYGDGTFDLVSCQFAFHHMPRPETTLVEMRRVTKPADRFFW